MRVSGIVRRLLVTAVATATMTGGLSLATTSAAVADESGPVTISGKVGCLNSFSPDGIWVEAANGGSGFAEFAVKPEEGLNGFGYAYYSYVLPHGGSYHLNVGCDGSPQRWGMTAHTAQVSGSNNSFTCDDISPALRTLGEWAFSRALGRWVKALDFTEGIPYGQCGKI
jgi:hypothetical protein